MRLIIFLLLFSLSTNGQIINGSQAYRYTAAPASYSYLLDSYTSAAEAWSLMKVKSDYSGYCIKIRRSSDNTTQDIGFVNNEVDTASIIAFVGANSAYVHTWYGQSGNGHNAVQTTNGNQPRIVNAGVISRVNGKVSINFINSSSTFFLCSSLAASSVTNAYSYVIFKDVSVGANHAVIGMGSNAITYQFGFATNRMALYNGNAYGNFPHTVGTSLNLSTNIYAGGGATNADKNKFYINSVQQTASSYSATIPSTISGTGIGIGRFYSTACCYFDGWMSEIVIWFNDKSADRSGIESNINTRYTIY